MLDNLANYFGTTGFMPHGHCFFWTPSLLWIYVVSDFIIAASYFSIPFALWYFVQKRPDVPFRWMFLMFGAFVLACGATHLFAIWNIWHADYWADAGLKALTASVSAATAFLLWPLVPKALTIPSHVQLENANRALQGEVTRREQAESALLAANEALERRVAERTAELETASNALRESEARFRSLTEMSSDFYWESDAEHRLTQFSTSRGEDAAQVLPHGQVLGKRRWQAPYLTPDEAGWEAHRAVLDAHLPFRDFEFSRLRADGVELHIAVSGDPVFHAAGTFQGYRGVGTHITERKRAEKDMRARELRYAAVAASAIDAFVTGDAAGRIVGWNPSAERIFGYAETEVIGQPLTLLMPQRFQDRHLDGMKRVQSGGERRIIGTIVELVGRRKDTSEFPLELSLAEWTVGEDQFFTGFMRDITERKNAEQALGESEARFRSLTEMSSDFYWESDAEHRLTRRSSGSKPSTLSVFREGAKIGKRRWEVPYLSPDEAGWLAHRAVLDAHRPFRDFELSRVGTDGAEHFMWISGDPVFDASGAFKGYHGVGADITERKRSEQALRAAEQQFRGLVEQSIAGIYIIQDDKLTYVNPRFAEILGYASADELIGRHPLSIIAEEHRGMVTENIRLRLEDNVPSISYGFTAVRKDGATIEVGVHGARVTRNGRPAIIGLMQDISDKKRAEEQIQRYVAQLETAFTSTVEVATTLSEMRDPYTAGHERRVGKIAVAIGAELGFDGRRIEGLRVAGYLHDIGKITIPAEILSKPGKLSPLEFRLIQAHPQASHDVLKDVEFPWPVAEVALQHHERMDGSGYPQGLKGEAILFEARIMAVADVIEAMSSHRPYRPGLGIEAALAEIERGRGSKYDPVVADACLRLFREKGYAIPA
ncbi:MAG: PAS domain S-box protein [Betaproteobacteria bacterium]|nr:PAS domain S-box protein [Betaproteobacteria bacterium]